MMMLIQPEAYLPVFYLLAFAAALRAKAETGGWRIAFGTAAAVVAIGGTLVVFEIL